MNAECNDGVCTCLSEYFGDPYGGCRPECVQNPDCTRDKACIQNKCTSPCSGACGSNAECTVVNHLPICSCPSGMTGNAFTQCVPMQNGSHHFYNMPLNILIILKVFNKTCIFIFVLIF